MIGFEQQVVAAICDGLPASSRLHTVGVGSAVNRSLTGPAARAGHGIEVIVGLGEDPERAASRLSARTDAPLLVDLVLGGSTLLDHAPARLPDLFAGAPALVGVSLRPEGGELTVRGRTLEGTWEQRLSVAPILQGQGNPAVVALYGREAIEDMELRLAAGGDAREIDHQIERMGVDFQIATRLTSWVAVSTERTVDPGDPLRRERMPHALPHGMSAEGLGLRPPVGARIASFSWQGAAAPKTGIESWQGRPSAPMQPRSRPGAPGGYAGGGKGGGAGGRDPGARFPDKENALRRAPQKAIDAREKMRSLEANEKSFDGERVPAAPPQPTTPPANRSPHAAPDASAVEGGRDALGAAFGEATVDAPRDARAEEAPPGTPVRRLHGRVVLQRADLFVVEILAGSAALAWAPAEEARVTLADGRIVVVAILRWRTTKPCTVAAGAAARLAIELPPGTPLEGMRSIQLDLGGVPVTVEL